jgi:hypothetical protein
MVTLALAGPGSRLGKNIVRSILSSQHELVTIARSPQPDLTAQGIPVHIFEYDASGIPALVAFLREHQVEALYSCLFAWTPGVYLDLLLLEAAKEAGVKRFAPSEWSFPAYKTVEIYAFKEVVWQECLRSGLEVTRFYCGVWTNIYARGAVRDEEEATGGFKEDPLGVDVGKRTARLLLDGNAKLTFTRVQDVAAFAIKALELPRWDPVSYIIGDVLSFNQIVQVAEGVTGAKFEIMYVTTNDIQERLKSGDFRTKLFAQYDLAITQGELHLKPEPGVKTLNELFPEVKAVTVTEFLEKHFRQ